MEIGTESAGRFYSAAVKASQPGGLDNVNVENGAREDGFVESVVDAAQETVNTIHKGEETARAMMAGQADAHSVIEALAQTEMALEMAVSVRDRVVAAYQEILRMPV